MPMTPKAKKDELRPLNSSHIAENTMSHLSSEFSFKMNRSGSPDRQKWLNKELTILM